MIFYLRIGVYFVLSCCIYNVRVKKAWEQKEAETIALQLQLNEVQQILSDKDWLRETEKRVRASKENDVLLNELQKKLSTDQSFKQVDPESKETAKSLPPLIDGNDRYI